MSSNRKKQISMEMTVGLFMFAMLLVLMAFTILLSTQSLFKTYYPLLVKFEEVYGLREGHAVRVRGLNVGQVKSLDLQPEAIYVELNLTEPIQLRDGYRIEIIQSSVLGGRELEIYEGPLDGTPLAEGAEIIGDRPIDLLEEARESINQIRESLVDGNVLENLEATMEEFKKIATQIGEGEGTLGKLVMNDQIYKDLEEVSANLKSVTAQLKDGEGTIGKLLYDDKVYNELTSISTNLNAISTDLAAGRGTIGKLLAEETVYNDLATVSSNLNIVSTRLAEGKGTLGKLMSEDDALYTDLKDAVAAIKDITQTISSGEGTLGRLAKDDELYEEVTRLLNEIRAAVDDFRETAPITSFTSVFFGAF